MSRISKAVREKAIDALLATADGRDRGQPSFIVDYADGWLQPVTKLAVAAFNSARATSPGDDCTVCLDAAALLRDGWCPGEPVVLIGGAS